MLADIPMTAPQRPAAASVFGRAADARRRSGREKGGDTAAAPLPAAARDKFIHAINTFREAQCERRDRSSRGPAGDVSRRRLPGTARANAARRLTNSIARRQQFYELAEGFAACVAQANLHHSLAEDPEAIAAWQRAASSPGRLPEPGEEVWVANRMFTASVIAIICGNSPPRKNSPHALALCDVLATAGKREDALELAAEARTGWSRELLRNAAAHGAESRPGQQRRQARDLLRTAGRDYVELAKLRFTTREYTKHVAQAAASYLAGGDYDRRRSNSSPSIWSTKAAPPFPKRWSNLAKRSFHVAIPKRPCDRSKNAWNSIRAIRPSTEGVCWPARPMRNAADRVKAIELLEENLTGRLTPASPEWRDAIFAEGRLLYSEAVRRESESRSLDMNRPPTRRRRHQGARSRGRISSSGRSPGSPRRSSGIPATRQALSSRYMIAESHRYSARFPNAACAKSASTSNKRF